MDRYIALGLLSPLMRSCTNYLDKFLLDDKHYSDTSHIIPVLLIFSSGIGVLVGIIALAFGYDQIVAMPFMDLLKFVGIAIVGIVAIYLYLRALNLDNPANVVPFFQMIPIFALFIGYILFSEAIAGLNLVGVLIIVLGAGLLSTNISTFQLNRKVVGLMGLSGFLFAVRDALFRIEYVDSNFVVSVFGYAVGSVVVAIALLCIRSHREGFVQTVRTNGPKLFFVNTFNEILSIGGVIIFFYISAFVYLAHLELLNTLQPVFLLIIGFILSKMYPENKDVFRSHGEWPKQVASIGLMILGVYLVTL